MEVERIPAAGLWAAVLATLAIPAHAQPAPAATPWHLEREANGDYTIPVSELAHSGTSGTATLHRAGMRTIVTVYVQGKGKRHVFDMHRGSDCAANPSRSRIALAPAIARQPSRTVVEVPLDQLTSKDYVLSVRDATSRANFQEACGHL